MVNTFITRTPLKEAVKDLDSRRLGKQRVEAFQILNLLLDANAIAEHFKWDPIPSEPGILGDGAREIWFKQLYKRYKAQEKRLYYNDTYSFEIKGRKVSGGFSNHPMTLMWVGYQEALKYYVNLCICEWVCRGYKNNMPYYIVFEDDIVLPWWVNCSTLHYSHCSALLRKEKVRKEPEWYWKIPHIRNVVETPFYRCGYLWVPHVPVEMRPKLLEDDGYKFCDSIKNDFVE